MTFTEAKRIVRWYFADAKFYFGYNQIRVWTEHERYILSGHHEQEADAWRQAAERLPNPFTH